MKKWLGLLLILILSIFVGYSTPIFSYAEETTEELEISTYYPENVLYYQNLDNINNISVNEQYIAFNLNNTSLNVLNKSTKELIKINNYDTIVDFKFISNNQLVLIDYNTTGTIYFIELNTDGTFTSNAISGISLNNLVKYDIYNNNNKILIGLIKSSTSTNNYFELYEIEIIDNTLSSPIKKDTYTSEQFNNARNLVITDTKLFVVFTNDDSQPRLLTRIYGSSTITTADTLANIQLLDYYRYNSEEYLVAFTLENLRLIPVDSNETLDTTLTEVSISDIDIFDGKIYIAETTEKSINSLVISTDDNDNIIFKQDNVLIASNSSALGRFNNVNDIFVQGNTLYVSDTKNNRVQILKDHKVSQINDLQVDTQPHSIQIDTNQNIYFVEKTSSNSSNIAKYSLNNEQEYERSANYSTYDLVSLGLVSDTTISVNNELYLLDYTNNKLLSLNTETGIQPKLTFDFTLTEFSQIEYIRGLNQLAVLNGNVIYLIDIIKLNTETEPIIDTIAVTNCSNIAAGLNSIITLNDKQIKCININNGIMQTSTKVLDNELFSEFSTITYNITDKRIYAFNSSTQAINYFDYEIENEELGFAELNNTLLSSTTPPLAITVLNDAIIYDAPYNLGNQHTNIDTCIGIELYNESYYRVLFKDNKNLKIGFLAKANAQISQHNTASKLNVKTTNQNVPVFKYPTLLKHNGEAIISEYIPIDTNITISNQLYPVSIDNKLFYAFENNGTIGYILNTDVILNDNSSIINLYNNNATIKVIGEDTVYIYAEDKTTILATINNDDRINVENYNKHSEYTLVHFKTDKLTTITGYVKTDYIEMDKLDNSKIVLIIVIIISIIMLVVIIVSYIVIKKKKN